MDEQVRDVSVLESMLACKLHNAGAGAKTSNNVYLVSSKFMKVLANVLKLKTMVNVLTRLRLEDLLLKDCDRDNAFLLATWFNLKIYKPLQEGEVKENSTRNMVEVTKKEDVLAMCAIDYFDFVLKHAISSKDLFIG